MAGHLGQIIPGFTLESDFGVPDPLRIRLVEQRFQKFHKSTWSGSQVGGSRRGLEGDHWDSTYQHTFQTFAIVGKVSKHHCHFLD